MGPVVWQQSFDAMLNILDRMGVAIAVLSCICPHISVQSSHVFCIVFFCLYSLIVELTMIVTHGFDEERHLDALDKTGPCAYCCHLTVRWFWRCSEQKTMDALQDMTDSDVDV